jgi:hypothetical protein
LRALRPVVASVHPSRLHLPAFPSLQARYGPSSLLWTLCLLPVRAPVLDPFQEHRLGNGQVSLIHAFSLPAIPSPPTCGCSALPGHVTPRQVEPRLLPSGNSGLHHWLAGSPHPAGRIEFVILRTGRSPPAALHPVSRRRSCSRLQVTLTWRGLSPLRLNALSGALSGGASPSQTSGHKQIGVDLHTQPGTLGH